MLDISDFPVPTSKRQLMRFFGMASYYRKFCNSFSNIFYSKKTKFVWNNYYQNAFDILKNEPVF